MKTTIITLLLVLILHAQVFSQTPPVVSAPIVESTLTATNATLTTQVSIQSTMSSVIASMEQSEKQFKDAMTKSTWMQNLAACQRLVTMVENLICTSKDLNAKISVAGGNCIYSYKYDIILVKVQMSADYLGIILSGVSMTVAERAQTFKAAAESFEQSQNMMIEMNNSLDADIKNAETRAKVVTEVREMMLLDRSKKRQ